MKDKKEQKDFHEHRKRVHRRIEDSGADSLADYELLEALLFHVHKRKDTKPIAKALMREFGSLGKVFHAERDRLTAIKDIGPAAAELFEITGAITRKIARAQIVKEGDVLSSWQAVAEYCRSKIGFSEREKFAALFLDSGNRLIDANILAEGTVNKVTAYPSEIARLALKHNAAAVVLVHNHPSGDTSPSRQDIEMTRTINQTLEGVSVTLHDHLIVSPKDETSFKSLGLLD